LEKIRKVVVFLAGVLKSIPNKRAKENLLIISRSKRFLILNKYKKKNPCPFLIRLNGVKYI